MNGSNIYEHDIRWIDVRNVGSATIPSFGLMRVTGVDTHSSNDDASGNVVTVDQPNTDNQDVLVNSVMPIAAGASGSATRESPIYAAYNAGDGTPVNGDTWGAANGSYLLRKNNSQTGFTICGGAIDGRVLVNRVGGAGAVSGVMGWCQRTLVFGTSFDFIYSGSITIAGSGSVTLNPVPPIALANYQNGDTLLISDGSGNTETVTVTSVGGGSITGTITGSTGSGTYTGMRVTGTGLVTTTRIGTPLFASTLYDYDFNAIDSVWISDPNGFVPTVGVYYMCQKGKSPIRLRNLWWINRSGPVVLGVSCGPNNQPLSTFGAAL